MRTSARSARWPWIAFCLLAALVVPGCEWQRERRVHALIGAAEKQVAAALRDVELAVVPAAGGSGDPAREEADRAGSDVVPVLRVVARPGEMAVDNAIFFSALVDMQAAGGGARVVSALGELAPAGRLLPDMVETVSWGPGEHAERLRPLIHAASALSAPERLARRVADSAPVALDGSPSPDGLVVPDLPSRAVSIHAARGITYGQIADVAYALGQAGHSRFAFAVVEGREEAGPAGAERASYLIVEAPRMRRPGEECLGLLLTATARGLFVEVTRSRQGGAVALLGDEGRGASDPPAWHGRSLMGEGGACPPVPAFSASAGASQASLNRIVDTLAQRGPLCDTAIVSATSDTTWQPVAEAITALAAHAAIAPVLATAIDAPAAEQADLALADCRAGIRPEDVVFGRRGPPQPQPRTLMDVLGGERPHGPASR